MLQHWMARAVTVRGHLSDARHIELDQPGANSRKVIKGADLSALFGIELESSTTTQIASAATKAQRKPLKREQG